MAHEDKTYLQSLRRLRRELKYESLENLVGTEISITRPDSIETDVTSALEEISEIGDLIEGSLIDKYELLDLTFELDPQPTGCARAKLRMLQEFGYLPESKEEAMAASMSGADPMNNGILYLLEEDLDKARIVLRLFLSPIEGKVHGNPRSSQPYEEPRRVLPVKDRLFPIRFRIDDACFTNADSIWLFKHFHM